MLTSAVPLKERIRRKTLAKRRERSKIFSNIFLPVNRQRSQIFTVPQH